jgi:hypothetical protein
MLPAKLGISYTNIFTYFDKLKEIFKFWASGCYVKGPLPPPLHTQDFLNRAAWARSKLGGCDMGGPFFPP